MRLLQSFASCRPQPSVMRHCLCLEIHCFYNPDNEGLCSAGPIVRELSGRKHRHSVVGKLFKLDGNNRERM